MHADHVPAAVSVSLVTSSMYFYLFWYLISRYELKLDLDIIERIILEGIVLKCQTLVLWRVFDEYQIIDMQSGKEKMSNMASAAKEKAEVYKAKAEEKVEKMTASTEEEKRIAEEKRRAKEAEAKMKLHESKAEHAANKLATAGPATGAPIGTGVPAYPLGGYSTRKLP